MKADILLATLKRMTATGYAVIDLETTGLDPARCEIAEIGLLVVRPGELPMPKSWLVNCTMSEEATKIHGITQQMVDSGVPLERAIDELCGKTVDVMTIVGHNYLRYDADVFGHAKPANIRADQFADRHAVVDTAALFKGGRLGQGQRENETLLDYQMRILDQRVFGLKYSLGYVCDELKINHSDCKEHRATGDIVMTGRILLKIIERLEAYEAKKAVAK